MKGILDRLEKLALIERQSHPEDRRSILVCLTGKGLSHAREINAIMVEANEQFLSQLGTKKSQKFRVFLRHGLLTGFGLAATTCIVYSIILVEWSRDATVILLMLFAVMHGH
jgi:hypothetical protein